MNLNPKTCIKNSECFSLLAVCAGRNSFVTTEEFAERGNISKMKTVGYLAYIELRCAEKKGGFCLQHLVDVVNNGVVTHLAYHA